MQEELKITAYQQDGGLDSSRSFTLLVDASAIRIESQNVFNNNSAMGSIGSDQIFMRSTPRSFSFKAILDGTGALGATVENVQDAIDTIKKICYDYQGDRHAPNKVVIVWGTLLFTGALSKLSISSSYFSSAGNLIGAELDMSFGESKTQEEQSKEKNNQSPDITHVVIFKAGDRLPFLCKNIYGNANLFPEIARINGLTDFRRIADNTKLIFPPLK